MNAISSWVVLSILMIGGEAQLTCYSCYTLSEEVDSNPFINSSTIFNDTVTRCDVDDSSGGVQCETGEVCGTIEVSLTAPDVEAYVTLSNCVPLPIVANFTCNESNDIYSFLLETLLLDWMTVNPSNPETQCRWDLCYNDLCNTGQAAQISLLVTTLISLYQLLL